MWTRISELSNTSLTRKAMYVQRDMCDRGKECWLKSLKSTLVTKTSCGTDMWAKWWSNPNFNVACARVDVDDIGMETTVRWEADCLISFRKNACDEWYNDVMRTNARRGNGLNKLRTYALFKCDLVLEPYLLAIEDRDKRVLLSKFRIGICPLRIETGRYEQVAKNKRGLPEIERICKCCIHASDMVENEHDFLLLCPAYENERKYLYDMLCNKFRMSVGDLQDSAYDINKLFVRIMQSDDSDIINSIADYLDRAFYKRECILLQRD